jgi:hypothetical protein
MNERKIININPDLFKTSSGGTRKKRDPEQKKEIKVKSQNDKQHNKTINRRILNEIRAQQEQNYKKLFGNENKKADVPTLPIQPPTDLDIFDRDFDESVNFLTSVSNKLEHKRAKENQTLKQYPSSNVTSLRCHPLAAQHMFSESVSNQLPESLEDMTQMLNVQPNMNMPMGPKLNHLPQYGCLKNGQLPTFRGLQRQLQHTQRNNSEVRAAPNLYPHIMVQSPSTQSIRPVQSGGQNLPSSSQFYPPPEPNPPASIIGGKTSVFSEMEKARNERKLKTSEMVKTMTNLKNMKTNKTVQPKYLKQKKTLRRTHYVGKSKIIPKVSVLISNKTIRNNISNKTQMLKQTPIYDIKRFLVKKGFIKVGSIAPNDVLRKMYESVSLICGEIQNHNPDNLLYNFFNDEK